MKRNYEKEIKHEISELSWFILSFLIFINLICFILGLSFGLMNDCGYGRPIQKYNPLYKLGCYLGSEEK